MNAENQQKYRSSNKEEKKQTTETVVHDSNIREFLQVTKSYSLHSKL